MFNNNQINSLKQFQTNKKTKLWPQGSRDLYQINSLKLIDKNALFLTFYSSSFLF